MQISENKILVLCMSCNKPEFEKMEMIIRNTWAKEIIDGRIKNMQFFFFTSTEDKERIDYENNKIYVKSGDKINNTFDKTRKCIKLINKNNIEYDYIVRVNTSTFINTLLLNNYISIMNQLNDTRILVSMLVKTKDMVFPCGKVLIFNKLHIQNILDYKGKVNNSPDDVIYGKIFCQNKEITELANVFKVPGEPIYYNWNNKHKYNSVDFSLENVMKYVFISVRDIYGNREKEAVTMLALYQLISNAKYYKQDLANIYFNKIICVVDNNGIIDIYRSK